VRDILEARLLRLLSARHKSNLWQNPRIPAMRSIYPIFTLLAAILAGQTLAQSGPRDAAEGNRLVASALQALWQQRPLEARIRQRSTLFGQSLTGAGHYLQARDGERLLVRYEFKLQLADQSHSLSHINDGSVLWVRREKGEMQAQCCVNVGRLREAAHNASGNDGNTWDTGTMSLALGGIGQLLANLARYFDFDTPQPGEFKGIPVWELSGKWNSHKAALLFPRREAALRTGRTYDGDELAEHLPDSVQLTLGRDDNFPLFPYRIEYLRTKRSLRVTGAGPTGEAQETLVKLELFEVRHRPDLTAADFRYRPGETRVDDLTDSYLQMLGLSGTKK
jgi:hypothetical protein